MMVLERIGRRGLLQAAALLAAGSVKAGGDNSQNPCPELVGLSLRVIHPGDMVTMDYREDRLTIDVNDDNVIQSLSIG